MAWNGSDGKTTNEPLKTTTKWFPFGIFGAIIVAVGIGLVIWLIRSPATIEDEASKSPNRAIPTAETSIPSKEIAPKPNNLVSSGKKAEKTVAKSHATSAQETKCVEANETPTNAVPPEKKHLFNNMMDQLLAMAMPKNPGEPMPPLPIADGQKFPPELEDKMLERLAVSDDDTEHTLNAKERVQAMRDEYFELKKRGWTFVDYLKAYQAKVALDAEVKHESLKMNEEAFLSKDLSDEDYKAYLDKINTVLSNRGIPPIHPTVSGQQEDEDGNPLPPDAQNNEEIQP